MLVTGILPKITFRDELM